MPKEVREFWESLGRKYSPHPNSLEDREDRERDIPELTSKHHRKLWKVTEPKES